MPSSAGAGGGGGGVEQDTLGTQTDPSEIRVRGVARPLVPVGSVRRQDLGRQETFLGDAEELAVGGQGSGHTAAKRRAEQVFGSKGAAWFWER